MLHKKLVKKRAETDTVSNVAEQRCLFHVAHEQKLNELGAGMKNLQETVNEIMTKYRVAATIVGIAAIVLGAAGSAIGAMLSPILMAVLKSHGVF